MAVRQRFLGLWCVALLCGPASARDVIIHAGALIDGTMAAPRRMVSIVIRDDRIAAIESGFMSSPGAEVIDLSASFVLPGLIEGHDHLGLDTDRDNPPARRRTHADDFINVVRNAYAEIDSGFTSTRDLGTYGVDIKAVTYAIAKGRIVGPRIWSSLEPLGPAGGHSDPWNSNLVGEHTVAERELSLVRGPVDAREKVRDHYQRGATLIKIMPSGGVSSLDDDPHATTMTFEEIKATVDAAHALGLKVAAHAIGLDSIRLSVRAGVDTIEHGFYADEAILQDMKKRGTFLDPAAAVANYKYQTAKAHPEVFDPRVLAKGMKAWPMAMEVGRAGYRLGVRIAMGTDQSSLGAGLGKATGIEELVRMGMSPQQAIVAATGTNAEMIGSADIGVVAPGRYADIIAVAKDPLKDIASLRQVPFVMKGGRVLKQNGTMIALP